MIGLLICISFAVTSGDPVAVEGQANRAKSRYFHEIDADIQAAFRREALAKSLADRGPAIRELAALHREIVGDSRYAASDTLQEFRGKIAVRLMSVKTDLKRKLANQSGPKQRKEAATANALTPEMENVLSANMTLVATTMGGPVRTLTQEGGARGGGMQDDGQLLVELIEATINPKFWNTNGGPGSVFYFAPLRCLVVRATSEVHDNLGGLVEGLRDAGR